jgi:predicted 3-demethylubiquinone-9 3-methyltransferase (glyoxalase superfamily)
MNKNTICLWYEHDAEEAARFYAKTFPQSSVGAATVRRPTIPTAKRATP